jgi:3',5'-cyclic AMP phosphodiesterase CpdA
MVQIQIVSDLHLEFRELNFTNLIIPSAPVLCLLGDICACGTIPDFEIFKKFMEYISKKFIHVIHVPGNHEYYTMGNKNVTNKDTISGIDKKIKIFLKKFNNVYFLNNNTISLLLNDKKYIFIGSTLWSNVLKSDRRTVQKLMNDYSYIYVSDKKSPSGMRPYTIEDMSKIHNFSVNYIKKIISNIKDDEICILLTHHKPVRDKPISDKLSQAYETDLSGVIIKHPIKLAAHGHTHVKYDKIVNNVRIVSNPKGYISQKTLYNNKGVYDI